MLTSGGLVITRRAALQGIGVVAALVLTNATPSPTPTPAPDATPSPSPAPTTADIVSLDQLVSTKTFDAAWTAETVTSFPRVVRVAAREEAAHLVIRWDARLFSVASEVFARTSEVVLLDPPTTYEPGNLAVVVPAGAQEVYLAVTAINLYPLENVGDVTSTAVSLLDSRGTVVGSVEAFAEHTQCSPWGVTVNAEWATRDNVIVPTLVSIASVGPNPVPAGTTVEINAAGVDVAGARLSGPATLTPSDGTTVGTLTDSLAAGAIVDIILPVSADASAPQKSPKSVARAALRVPEVATGLRVTEREAAYPLTSSGSPVSSFEADPSA